LLAQVLILRNGKGDVYMKDKDIVTKYKRLLAVENIKSTLNEILPGPGVEGDPFWTIMEVGRDGIPTGSYHTVIRGGKRVLPLYEKKSDAEEKQPESH